MGRFCILWEEAFWETADLEGDAGGKRPNWETESVQVWRRAWGRALGWAERLATPAPSSIPIPLERGEMPQASRCLHGQSTGQERTHLCTGSRSGWLTPTPVTSIVLPPPNWEWWCGPEILPWLPPSGGPTLVLLGLVWPLVPEQYQLWGSLPCCQNELLLPRYQISFWWSYLFLCLKMCHVTESYFVVAGGFSHVKLFSLPFGDWNPGSRCWKVWFHQRPLSLGCHAPFLLPLYLVILTYRPSPGVALCGPISSFFFLFLKSCIKLY